MTSGTQSGGKNARRRKKEVGASVKKCEVGRPKVSMSVVLREERKADGVVKLEGPKRGQRLKGAGSENRKKGGNVG